MVKDLSSLEIIAEFVEAVIVKAVGVDGQCAVLEHYIVTCPCQLVESVIVKHFAVKQERIALVHPHMAEGVEGIGRLVVEGAVAIQEHTVVTELHVAHQYLRGAVHSFVEEEAVGMQQVNLAVGRRTLPGSFAHRCYSHYQAETEEQGRTEDV